MITIAEKDGATIIVVENPTAGEQRVIQKAKEVMNNLSPDFWSKFKCNTSANTTKATPRTSSTATENKAVSSTADFWSKFKKDTATQASLTSSQSETVSKSEPQPEAGKSTVSAWAKFKKPAEKATEVKTEPSPAQVGQPSPMDLEYDDEYPF